MVVHGNDAGGRGAANGASVMILLPEVVDALRAVDKGEISLVPNWGIVNGKGVAAAIALGADAVIMRTRLMASREAKVSNDYQDDMIRITRYWEGYCDMIYTIKCVADRADPVR